MTHDHTSLSLEFSQVAHRYQKKKTQILALCDINLTIPPGVFGLLGRNGAGKTTLLQIAATLLIPTHGTVHIGTYDVQRQRRTVRTLLGYLPQEHGFYPALTVQETLMYLATLSGLKMPSHAVARALEAVNLQEQAPQRTRTLSGGMRRRLGLAQALLGDPPVLIIDEPTAGLDPIEQQRFHLLLGDIAAQGNRTVILSTHIVADIATLAKQVAVLERGKLIFQGSVRDLQGYASGRVWEWHCPFDKVDALRRDPRWHILSLAPENGTVPGPGQQVVVRVVGTCPAEDAIPVAPSLEDGYFALLRKSDGETQ